MPAPIAASLLANRRLLILGIALILVAGLAAWSSLPRIEDPRITNRNVTVLAALPAATRHIVATTLTTVGGFLPLFLFSGGDFWPPLAVVIAGGVGLSIGLGLVFTPALYLLVVARRPSPDAARRTGEWERRPMIPHAQA